MAYANDNDLDDIYGSVNVDKWADLDNDENSATINSRRAWALQAAEAELDDLLREGPYAIPFGTAPSTIVIMCARLAGVMLYESRGVQDVDPETGVAIHRLIWHRREVEKKVKQIHRGTLRLDLTKTFTDYPCAVVDEEPATVDLYTPEWIW